MTQAALKKESISSEQCLYMAFELSHKEWKLAFGTGPLNPRIIGMPARDLMRLDKEIVKAKKHLGLSGDAEVFSCFEAGRDGHWIHRHLETRGVHSLVVDSPPRWRPKTHGLFIIVLSTKILSEEVLNSPRSRGLPDLNLLLGRPLAIIYSMSFFRFWY